MGMGGNRNEAARAVSAKAVCNTESVTERPDSAPACRFRYRSKRHQDPFIPEHAATALYPHKLPLGEMEEDE